RSTPRRQSSPATSDASNLRTPEAVAPSMSGGPTQTAADASQNTISSTPSSAAAPAQASIGQTSIGPTPLTQNTTPVKPTSQPNQVDATTTTPTQASI
ncbi:unnamed protein product, partial [Musa textilis]